MTRGGRDPKARSSSRPRRVTWADDRRATAFLAEPVTDDVADRLRRLLRDPAIARLVVLPDVHLAGDVCVGCVVATRDRVFPDAVGGDIGCGVTTARLEVDAAVIDATAARRVLDALSRAAPIRARPRGSRDRPLPDGLEDAPLSLPALTSRRRSEGRAQFGTLGRGNHFLELQRAASDGALHVSVHSGSRAMGPAIRDAHLTRARRDGAGLPFLADGSAEAEDYRADAAWAGAYAAANRRAILVAAWEVLAEVITGLPAPVEPLDCDHNHVRTEHHVDETLLVHRKGALAAGDGALAIIPGSMGTPSFLVEGRGAPASLASSSHGAGRALPRGAAAKTLSLRDVRRSLRDVWIDEARLPQLLDEAPDAYKDIAAVMRAQRDLVRIRDRLDPVLSWKGA